MVEITVFEYILVILCSMFLGWFLACLKHDVWNLFDK